MIMGRGRPKGVKDSRPRTVNTTQKSKHNKGGNGGTAAAKGERSTTALTFNEQRERGMLPRAALHQENVISNEQLNHQRVEAGQMLQFSRSAHGLPLLVLLSFRIHYASLHVFRFLCEVACLSVK
jgi:hypothetical protein